MSVQGDTLKPLNYQGPFSLNCPGMFYFDVREWSVARAYAWTIEDAAWGTAVFTVKHAPVVYGPLFSIDTSILSDATLGPGNDYSLPIDVSAINFLVLDLTTLEGAEEKADIGLVVKRATASFT